MGNLIDEIIYFSLVVGRTEEDGEHQNKRDKPEYSLSHLMVVTSALNKHLLKLPIGLNAEILLDTTMGCED